MSTQTPAMVDYQKPLDDVIPYAEQCAARVSFHAEVKARIEAIVGSEVSDSPEALARYAADLSLEQAGRPAFVVRPQSTEQICELVRCAGSLKMPVIALSSGTHLYGAGLARMGGMVLDLSGWQDIHAISHRNRCVRIAPGVTYDQLQDALEPHGLRSLIPLLPRRDQSVLSAHLEAQPMLIPEFNYSEPMYTAEIVLASGEIFRTGAAAVAPPDQTANDMVGPWGPGLDWNRLLTRAQGTLGVVTWANIMAEPLPLKQKIFFTAASSLEPLLSFTSRVQKKWLGYECFILNRANLACILANNPDEIEALQQVLPAFVQVFCIGGLKRFPDERIAWQEADFLETSQECGLAPKTVMPEAPRAARFFEKNLRRSFPGEVYWKDARRGASADIFFITTMDRVPVCIAEMQQQAAQAGYNFQDIGIYVQPIENGRVAHLEFSLPYNPTDERARTRMRALHESASRAMFTQGALFTRAYGSWAQLAHGCNAAQQQTARLIKELLDPSNIMNPGRLGI